MASNDFLPLATAGGANVVSQATYAGLAALLANGYQTGIANSAQLNKTFRQSSIMAAVVAQIIADTTGANSVDDGTTATLVTNGKKALVYGTGQVWATVTRTSGTIYQNTSGVTQVLGLAVAMASTNTFDVYTDNTVTPTFHLVGLTATTSYETTMTVTIPSGAYYKVVNSGATYTAALLS